MRLSEFIRTNRQAILTEWEAFARSCTPAAQSMDLTSLSDHAGEMLLVVARPDRPEISRHGSYRFVPLR